MHCNHDYANGTSFFFFCAFISATDVLLYMDEIQLKILWTMLFGTLSLLGLVIYDLKNGPFRGSYKVSNAIIQLITIRNDLKSKLAEI
mmetsp:Transcript_12691/g.19010  ORF Transcript_12691/g.19010 Transcript_12691/m.19010 type:complete len:88 (+) Transcript_12691:593-856(+)